MAIRIEMELALRRSPFGLSMSRRSTRRRTTQCSGPAARVARSQAADRERWADRVMARDAECDNERLNQGLTGGPS